MDINPVDPHYVPTGAECAPFMADQASQAHSRVEILSKDDIACHTAI